MAVLIDSGVCGTVQLLLVRPDNVADITSVETESVNVSFAGFDGESHSGLTRAACVRVERQYSRGTEIRNVRQVTIVSTEELALIAGLMQIDHISPAWLGANMCLSGVPELTYVPPSSRLIFSGGVSLVVDMENEPCKYPAEVINQYFPRLGGSFVKHAMGSVV